MKRFLLALALIFLALPALAQALNPPQWATGYINVAAGTTVTTNVTNSFTAPTNLNITAGGAITTWNVRMPSPAFDGQLITIACPYGNVATLNVTAVAPDTVQSGGPNSCTSVPGQAVQYQYFQLLAQWTVLSTGTSPGGSGTMGMVNLAAGTNITLSGSCNSPTAITCTINTPASMGSVAVVAGTNITLSGTCSGTASINCTVNAAGGAFTAGTGLTLTGTVFSLGGDSGNITYTSPGQLQLGKSGTVGTVALGNITSGLLTLKTATGALGANSITFPASGGIIAAAAFLGVGSGLTSSAGNIILGDASLTYSVGAFKTTAGDNTIGANPGLRAGWQFTYNNNLTTTSTASFADNIAMYMLVNNNAGINVYDTHFRAKTTLTTLYLNTLNIAAGQRTAFTNWQFCYGMGDCSAVNYQVQFAGGPIHGDEGQNFSASQFIRQQPFLVRPTITSVPAQTLCNTVTTAQVFGSSTPQTINVADSTNCAIGNWVVMNVIQPDATGYTEAVKLTGVGTNTLTGAFLYNYNFGAIVTFGAITPGTGGTDGTYNNTLMTGGSGTLAKANITVLGGVVTAVDISATQGINYVVGDSLTASPGGVTGFSVLVASTCCGPWTVTPATVLNVSSTGSFGEQRVIVNHTQPSYTTGIAASGAPATTGAFTGIGTTWATNMVGGNTLNEGCVTLAADDYSGPTVSNGTFTIPLQAWYEIVQVTNTTSLSIFKTTTAGDSSYAGNGQYASFTGSISGPNLTTSAVSGIISAGTTLQGAGIAAGTTIVSGSGSAWVVSISQTVASEAMVASMPTNVGFGTGLYTISPCARILKVVGGSQVILNNNPFTWTALDQLEEITSPYADVHGIQYNLETYTPGAQYRSLIELDNDGARTSQTGILIRGHMQVGGGADTVAWGIGVNIGEAAIGVQLSNTVTTAMLVAGNGNVCWGTITGTCIGPSTAIGGGLQIGGTGLSNGQVGSQWQYSKRASNALNPINNPMSTFEVGGNFLVSAVSNVNTMTTNALAATIGFDPGTAAPWEAFRFGNLDGIAESMAAGANQKMLIYATNGIHLYGNTAGTDPTGSNSSLGTVTVFQGGLSEPELALENNNLTQNVTLIVSGAGVLTVLGNGSGTSNGGIIVGAETVNSFAGTGSRPVCVTSTGVLEVGSLSAGLVTCP